MDLDLFQLACLPVLLCGYALSVRGSPRRWARVAEIAALVGAGFLGEQTCITLYRFYEYDSVWALGLGDVPGLVPLIWPMVVLSSREIVSALWPRASALSAALLVGALVTLDASLMEVVAVGAGYWRWSEVGYLGIPLIGILGWGFFATAVTAWMRGREGDARRLLLLPLVALAGTHLLLLGAWWGVLRWIWRGEAGPFAAVPLAIAALALAVAIARAPGRAATRTLVARVLAAALFLTLLAATPIDAESPRRWLHVGLVAVPYLVLCIRWRPARG